MARFSYLRGLGLSDAIAAQKLLRSKGRKRVVIMNNHDGTYSVSWIPMSSLYGNPIVTEYQKERREHPTLPKETVLQIVRDHGVFVHKDPATQRPLLTGQELVSLVLPIDPRDAWEARCPTPSSGRGLHSVAGISPFGAETPPELGLGEL